LTVSEFKACAEIISKEVQNIQPLVLETREPNPAMRLAGVWKIPYSYFEIELAGDIYWFEDVLVLGIRFLALLCNSFFALQLLHS